ncbi:hypothetical protein B0H16DRAFT_433773 [Mycena metata]|uniref:Uncharacterized protein n=1 Tax=Mycena metata TaxID=1033252 RepID=A0AAD7HCY7_9AGAR|nr:hypothetical protein B0H16DRAFT_433773 [Mycena metata]
MSILRALITAVLLSVSFAASVEANATNTTIQGVTARQSTTWNQAAWIWANSYSTATKDAPLGAIVLRRSFQPTIPLPLVDVTVSISADNGYYLYVNGRFVGSGLNWAIPDTWTANNIVGTSPIVVAIVAVNNASPGNTQTGARGGAGVLATFTVSGNNGLGGIDEYQFFTDGNWRGAWFVPDGAPDFTTPNYIDTGSPWAGASVEGGYGIGPWGILPEPTARSLC